MLIEFCNFNTCARGYEIPKIPEARGTAQVCCGAKASLQTVRGAYKGSMGYAYININISTHTYIYATNLYAPMQAYPTNNLPSLMKSRISQNNHISEGQKKKTSKLHTED